jgi:hypothetical protein
MKIDEARRDVTTARRGLFAFCRGSWDSIADAPLRNADV